MVAGPDIDASGAWDAAVALAERQRLPVWAIPAPGGGRLGFPEGHPNFQGVLPPAIGPVAQTLEGHDLVLVVGARSSPTTPTSPGPLLPEGASLVAITSDPDEAARAPDGRRDRRRRQADAGAPARRGRRVGARRAARAPAARRAAGLGPDQRHRGDARARRRAARGRDRRRRGAVEHRSRFATSCGSRARQLLLRRRRRPRLRPRVRGRRAARPARPAGRLRARRGLGAVRDHRLLDARVAYEVAGHVPRPAQLRVRDPQVVRRRSSRSRARPASTCRSSTPRRSPTATGSARAASRAPRSCASALREAIASDRAASWSRSAVAPGMWLF